MQGSFKKSNMVQTNNLDCLLLFQAFIQVALIPLTLVTSMSYLNMNSFCKINTLRVYINHVEKLVKMKYDTNSTSVHKVQLLLEPKTFRFI